MKFHESILNGFWVTERTRPYRKIYYFQFQRAITPKIRNPELRFLQSARRLMLLHIRIKFHENIPNGFGVTEQTRFCLRNCYLQSSKVHNSKSINTRVMVLAFCWSSNVGEYFYEVSWRYLERFLSYRADTTISQNLLFSISKGRNSKNTQSRVTVLALYTSTHVALHLCKVSWKYLELFWSYRADTILWQTDGQTTKAKTRCLPTLRGEA